VKDNRDLCLLSKGPERIEPDMAWGMSTRAAARDQQSRGSGLNALLGDIPRPCEFRQWNITSRKESWISGAELGHRAVMRAGDFVGEVEVVSMFPVVEPTVMEGVEYELTRYADMIDCSRSVFRNKTAGGGKVLAVHDLSLFVRAILLRSMSLCEPYKGCVDISELLIIVACLAKFVHVARSDEVVRFQSVTTDGYGPSFVFDAVADGGYDGCVIDGKNGDFEIILPKDNG
jgi:hypothetical protein